MTVRIINVFIFSLINKYDKTASAALNPVSQS